MEKPTTDEVGSEDLEAASPAVGRSKDAHDFLTTGGADTGAGVDADAGEGAGADAGIVEGGAASGDLGTTVSRDGVGTTAGGSRTSVGAASWVTTETTTPFDRSHDSDLDFT